MSTDLAIDIDRVLDSAVADVGEAQQLRRSAADQASLRRGLRGLADEPVPPGQVDPQEAARRATAASPPSSALSGDSNSMVSSELSVSSSRGSSEGTRGTTSGPTSSASWQKKP